MKAFTYGVAGLILVVMTAGCATGSRFVVTPLGYEPEEFIENQMYALPMDHLKVSVVIEKEVFVPGPYGDYAMKLLGISEVRRDRSVKYSVKSVNVEKQTEPDGEQLYSVNVLEGTPSLAILEELDEKGLVYAGLWTDHAGYKIGEKKSEDVQEVPFPDVTMEPNIETRTETIFKTIVTDTSFIRVPVQTEQLEQKTRQRKAEEAARFILELRADRYYLAAGLMDPYPQDFDLKEALNKLDELEREYLSLFLGKIYTVQGYREYLVTPGALQAEQRFVLDRFSERYGFTSGEDAKRLELVVLPAEKTRSLRNLMPQVPEPTDINRLYYRIPEITEVRVFIGDEELEYFRLPIFQLGAMVNVKLD